MSRRATISGVGGELPGEPVGNAHFASYLDTDDAWIVSRTGIEARHRAPADMSLVDLALPAAERALASAKVKAAELDLIIMATTTPDQFMPATACLLQARLDGAAGCPAFDVQAVCSGFVYALQLADAAVRAGQAERVLVVGADMYSRILDYQDRGTCILFGDGAGAAVVTATETEGTGIAAVDLHADGRLAAIIETPGRVSGQRLEGTGAFAMDGPQVYKVAIEKMAESARAVCDQAAVAPADLAWLVAHQANLRIIDRVAKDLGLADERVVRTVARHANTSAASIPLALASVWDRIVPGDWVLFTAAGGGFTWGSVLWRA
ncbi:MAG: ketoacyl-ACP synthase III [Betaproteobacteria bacterium AqS2]|uniref:Beta-ketoacyl-[acyl-carrier-protein] synthase III n=1 Tax=Candidatus Amphirhobacter heronislandensis TaxID=1732024 RepID=A0A930XYF9_9GAMM|nr:ketoacyl-ACP synthase III [Betaproteobacteria bacterium AqS2]